MTVVVGIRGKKGVLLAADSAATLVGWGDQRERQNGKAHLLTDTVAVAICGSPRISQLIRFMNVPDLPLGTDEYRWAVQTFIPAVRSVLSSGGCLKTSNGVESFYGDFLLAVRNRLFSVGGDFQVAEEDFPWTADGSGGEVAAGHFRSILGERTDPVDDDKLLSLARAAVETACELNAYCRGRVTHVRTKRFTAEEKRLAEEVLS